MQKRIVITIIIILIAIALIASLTFVIVKRNQEDLQAKEQHIASATNENLESNIMEDKNGLQEKVKNETVQQKNEVETEQVQVIDSERLSEIVSMSDMFGKYYEKAKDILNTMTLEEKVGQMFLARYPEENANEEIIEYNPGGYVLFSRDFKNETKDSILEKLNKNQSNSKIKMFVGVDEEGGSVVRVSEHSQFRSSIFKSPKELLEEGGMERVIEDSHEKSELLKSLGINMNLAPVVDVSTDENSFIYNRTIGKSAEETADYTKTVVKKMNEDMILSSLKHFPRIWK